MSFEISNILKIHQNNHLLFNQAGANMVILSELNTCEKVDNCAKLSIKTVLDGTEYYRVNNNSYQLKKNEFLLVNKGDDLKISFDEKKKAVGVCFYVEEKYVNQAIKLQEISEDWFLDTLEYSRSETFLTSTKYSFKQSDFGRYLNNVAKCIRHDSSRILTEDFFMDFAARLVDQQKGVLNRINKLHSIKLSTRKEIYKRVAICKEYIEANASNQNLSISCLAKISALSEVQLHRSFKQIYHISPYQYVLKKKLEIAKKMLESNHTSISEIAILTGFADLPSFSKCFRAHFGISPLQFIKNF